MNNDNQSTSAVVYTPHPDVQVRGIDVRDGVMNVDLNGQIRYASVGALQEFLFEQFCNHMPQSLVLDFSHVSFLDSQGLAFIISLYKFCFPQGCTLGIRGANEHVLNLIKLTRLNAFIRII